MRKLNTNIRRMNWKRIKAILAIFVVLACFYPFVKEYNRREGLKHDKTILVKALVTSEKHILPNSRVSFPFTYGHQFYVNGKRYEGNTHDEKYIPGEYIIVEYVEGKPEYNMPKGYYK